MSISKLGIPTALLHPSIRSRISLTVFCLMTLLSLYSIGHFQPQRTAADRPVEAIFSTSPNVLPIKISQFVQNFTGMPAAQASSCDQKTIKYDIHNTPRSHVVDNFPIAAMANSPDDLPQVPLWNRPPKIHVTQSTPLLIGFTRNWPLLQQTITSYITAGWPPSDIFVGPSYPADLTILISIRLSKILGPCRQTRKGCWVYTIRLTLTIIGSLPSLRSTSCQLLLLLPLRSSKTFIFILLLREDGIISSQVTWILLRYQWKNTQGKTLINRSTCAL